MAVAVCRHLHRGVTEPGLHHLERQFEPAIDPPVDAPGGIEMPQAVQAGVFRLARCCDDAGGNLRRMEAAIDDVGMAFDTAAAVGEDEPELALWAGELRSPATCSTPWAAVARCARRPPTWAGRFCCNDRRAGGREARCA